MTEIFGFDECLLNANVREISVTKSLNDPVRPGDGRRYQRFSQLLDEKNSLTFLETCLFRSTSMLAFFVGPLVKHAKLSDSDSV